MNAATTITSSLHNSKRYDRLRERQDAMRQRLQGSSTTVLDSQPPLTVQEAAARLRVSPDWVRSRFAKIPGTLVMPSLKKRGKRKYDKILIPVSVFESTLRSWSVS